LEFGDSNLLAGRGRRKAKEQDRAGHGVERERSRRGRKGAEWGMVRVVHKRLLCASLTCSNARGMEADRQPVPGNPMAPRQLSTCQKNRGNTGRTFQKVFNAKDIVPDKGRLDGIAPIAGNGTSPLCAGSRSAAWHGATRSPRGHECASQNAGHASWMCLGFPMGRADGPKWSKEVLNGPGQCWHSRTNVRPGGVGVSPALKKNGPSLNRSSKVEPTPLRHKDAAQY
jgi:hypothetical protein